MEFIPKFIFVFIQSALLPHILSISIRENIYISYIFSLISILNIQFIFICLSLVKYIISVPGSHEGWVAEHLHELGARVRIPVDINHLNS